MTTTDPYDEGVHDAYWYGRNENPDEGGTEAAAEYERGFDTEAEAEAEEGAR